MSLTDNQKALIDAQVVGARERRNAKAFGDILAPLSAQADHVADAGAVSAPPAYTGIAEDTYTKATVQACMDQVHTLTVDFIAIQPLAAKVTALIHALEAAGLMQTS